MSKVKNSSKKLTKPKRDRELPVTKRLLDLTKQELKSEMSSIRLEMRAGFKEIDARFTSIDARFLEQDSKFDAIQAQLTKMMVLLEDQNDRNRTVLDAYTTVYEKFVDTDSRVEKIEVRVFGAKQN